MRLLESALAPAWAIRLLQCWVCQVCRLCQVCQLPTQPCSCHHGLENLVLMNSEGHFQHLEITAECKPVRTHTHTFTYTHSQSRGHSFSQMFPPVPLTPVPPLHRAEEASASTGMSSSTKGSHSHSLLRAPGASQGCVVGAGCMRGDTVHSQLLEHLPPSCCPRVLGLLGEPAGLLSRNRVFISLLRKIDSFPKLKKSFKRGNDGSRGWNVGLYMRWCGWG